MKSSPENLHAQLVQLFAEMPDLSAAPMTDGTRRWIARVTVVVEATKDLVGTAVIKAATAGLAHDPFGSAEKIKMALHVALARVELELPAGVKSGFIAAGSPFDALMMIGKVLGAAKTDALVVDPYADAKLLDEFATQAPEGTKLRILATGIYKAALNPAASRWLQQHGKKRPLEVRLAANPKDLHDRLIIVDAAEVWLVSQSFNQLAQRASATVTKADADLTLRKLAAYSDLWQATKPI